MKLTKFEDIVQHNINNIKEASACVEKFYNLLGMEYSTEIKNISQVVWPLFFNKQFIIIQLPLKDKEIGAFCFKGNHDSGYVILNSSLSPYNVNFAIMHEVCHVCINDDIASNNVEMFLDDTYSEHDEERIANQFAGMILLPEGHLRRMYEKFASETFKSDIKDELQLPIIVCKLMSYFEAPYIAVLIRLREIGLIDVDEDLVECLKLKKEDIEDIYNRCWLDLTALQPSYRDDYSRLTELLLEIAKENIEEDIMYESDVKETLENISKIYMQLREDR